MNQCTRCCGFIDPLYGPIVELDAIHTVVDVRGNRIITRVRCVPCVTEEILELTRGAVL